jgi:hypothetical protein
MYFIETGESELDLPDKLTANSNKTITKDGAPANLILSKNISQTNGNQQIQTLNLPKNVPYDNLNQKDLSININEYGTYFGQTPNLNNIFY